MNIKYAVIKRDGFTGLLIKSVGTFDNIDNANEHKEHCENTCRIQNVYYEVVVVLN